MEPEGVEQYGQTLLILPRSLHVIQIIMKKIQKNDNID